MSSGLTSEVLDIHAADNGAELDFRALRKGQRFNCNRRHVLIDVLMLVLSWQLGVEYNDRGGPRLLDIVGLS